MVTNCDIWLLDLHMIMELVLKIFLVKTVGPSFGYMSVFSDTKKNLPIRSIWRLPKFRVPTRTIGFSHVTAPLRIATVSSFYTR